MPMYEYACQACGHSFEARQKFSDAPLTTCPQCQGEVRKLISQAGFALKGGGWFQQSYGSGGAAPSPACAVKAEGGGCAGCPKAAHD